jgi:hypothetical protein
VNFDAAMLPTEFPERGNYFFYLSIQKRLFLAPVKILENRRRAERKFLKGKWRPNFEEANSLNFINIFFHQNSFLCIQLTS